MKTVGFIGCGNLSQAIIRGILSRKLFLPSEIFASNRSPQKLEDFARETNIQKTKSNLEVAQNCKIVFVGTKPADFKQVVDDLSTIVAENHIIVSLAAGIKISTLSKVFPKAGAIVRLMPNTACLINEGVIGFLSKANSNSQSVAQILEVKRIVEPLGIVIEVKTDSQIDGVLGASASGIGFVFRFIEEFCGWLESEGFDPQTSKKIAVQTFLGGSLQAHRQQDKTIQQLRESVVSKKGTTEAGLKSMDALNLSSVLRAGPEGAKIKSQEIGQDLEIQLLRDT